jgi:hypothetical protein
VVSPSSSIRNYAISKKGPSGTLKGKIFVSNQNLDTFHTTVARGTCYSVPRGSYRKFKGSNDTWNAKIFVFQPIFTKFGQHVVNQTSYKGQYEMSSLHTMAARGTYYSLPCESSGKGVE